MVESIRALITEVDEAGKSRFRSTDLIEPVFPRTPVGTEGKERTGTLWPVWGTSDGIPTFRDPAEPVLAPFFPGPGGTRFAVFSLPPDSSFTDVAERDGASPADLIGLEESHETDGGDASFHATNSIDYIFVLDGEIVLELDEGKREVLTRGSCLVQRGTRHAWRNVSTKPAILVTVIVGVEGGL
jgi:mannose-6-phosphate isomerase-like protein (cupin superfamily)